MNAFHWVLGGAGTLAVVVAVMYFAGFGGVVRVVRAVFDFLGDVAERARNWLREPGNKTRAMAGLFVFGFMAASLQSWHRGVELEQREAAHALVVTDLNGQLGTLRRALGDRDAVIARFRELADEQKRLLDQLAGQNAAAVAAAQAAREKAAETEAKFQAEFSRRPPECRTALEVMAKACPTLRDY